MFISRPYKLWTLTCTIRVPTRMLHVHSAHLFAHVTDPRTGHSIVLPDGRTHVLRTALRCPFLTQTTPTPPLDAPKKHSVRSETHQTLTVLPHPFGSAHVHPHRCAVSHQFSILVYPATCCSPCPPSASPPWASLTTNVLDTLVTK